MMKIMSFNVNQFRILHLTGPMAMDIINVVKTFLKGDNDNLVFLYEVPYGYFGVSDLFREFENEFASYELYHWGKDGEEGKRACFCTVAVCNRKGGWDKVSAGDSFKVVENGEEEFRNRYIELEHRDKQLRVLGVHASLDGTAFLESLEKYAKKKQDTNFMVVGDLNCHRGDSSSHREYLIRLTEKGGSFRDLVKDTDVTFFPSGKAIDHVLVSGSLEGRVSAHVDKRRMSDHAIISAEVEL